MNILIVEDDKKIANYSKQGFEEENFVVDLSYTGEEGLELIKKNSYDIIILDWMLPGINGIEVCKRVRKLEIITPVIILTAKIGIEDRVYGLNSGADDYVPKPFSFEELLARVNALVRRASYKKNDIVKIDNLTIDFQKKEVYRDNKKINLTIKEYDILELLIKNRGHVVKMKSIIGELWESNDAISSNIINVYMHHLRHKIDKGHKTKLIKTVRKHGFKIDTA